MEPPDTSPKLEDALEGGIPGSLARRSLSSISWNVAANIVKAPIGLVQSILLARLLPVEYFGILAGVVAVVALTSTLFEFGLSGAYFHRDHQTEDEEQTTAILFTLRLIFYSLWALLLVAGSLIFLDGLRQLALLVMAGVGFAVRVLDTPRLLLMRRVQHRRLAALDLSTTILSSVISILIAWFSRSIWALLVSQFVMLALMVVYLYLYKPVWRIRVAWDWNALRYYLGFGSRNLPGILLAYALDYFDDLWTNIFLGDLKLGYYSRAYKFATYPRLFLAVPVNNVASAAYAELKNDRLGLSQTFFRINALLVRTGFLFGGWLFLVAPQFVSIFLGEQWQPMVGVYRLMLVFTLLDPIMVTVIGVLVAVGKPEKSSLVRLIQFVALLAGLFTLGPSFEIAGVAVALDLMLAVGLGCAFYLVKPYLDFSIPKLFIVPAAAMALGGGLSWFVEHRYIGGSPDWTVMIWKTFLYGLVYLSVLLGFEGRMLQFSVRELLNLARKTDAAPVEHHNG